MALRTNGASNSFIASGNISNTLLGGASRIAVGFWVKWNSDRAASIYETLWGSRLSSTASTNCFSIKTYASSGVNMNLGLQGPSGLETVGSIGILKDTDGMAAESWYRIFYDIDAAAGTVGVWVNGGLYRTDTISFGSGRTIYDPGVPYSFDFRLPQPNALTGGLAKGTFYLQDCCVYRTSIPTGLEDFNGIRTGVVLRYQNYNATELVVQPAGGDTNLIDDTSASNADIPATSGSALITTEVAAATANMTIAGNWILESGTIWRVDWLRGAGRNFRPTFLGYPEFRKNGGPWIQGTNAFVKIGSTKYIENYAHYVIPDGARPTSISDVIEARLAARIVKDTDADFNAAETLTCNNQYGVERFPLPTGYARPPLLTNYGAIRGNTAGQVNLLGAVTTYGNRTKSILANGIPYESTNGEDCLTSVTETGSPLNGIVHCLWKGTATSKLAVSAGYQTYHPTYGAKTQITGPDGQLWYKQSYTVVNDSFTFAFVRDSAIGSAPWLINITDAAVVLETEGDDHTNLDRWVAGKRFLQHELRKLSPFKVLRFMDEMRANNGNVTGMVDVVPPEVPFQTAWVNPRTETLEPPSGFKDIVVTGIENYSYPNQATGFFANSRTIAKLTISGTKAQWGLRTGGATLKMTGFLWRRDSGDTTNLASHPWVFDCEGDPADPLSENEIIVSAGPEGTLDVLVPGVNPAMQLTNTKIYHPQVYIDLVNEIFEEDGKYPTLWICKPLTMSRGDWRTWIDTLDAGLPIGVDLCIEWVNEVWNTAGAFQGQTRFMTGTAARTGKDQHLVYCEYAIEAWDDAKSVTTPGRRVSLIIGGQLVDPAILKNRMAFMVQLRGGSYQTDDIIMTVSNYHDDIGYTGSVGNANAALECGPEGIIDVYDAGYRDTPAAYAPVKLQYNKPLYAYEGGASWQAPTNFGLELVRNIFCAVHHPRMRNVLWGCFDKYYQEAGYDVMAVLALTANMEEGNGKNWGTYKAWDQPPGVGDGTDGKFNNVADFNNYITGGAAGSDFEVWVSPRGQGLIDWVATDSNQPPVALAGADQTVVQPADSTTINGSGSYDTDGTIVSYSWQFLTGPATPTITTPTAASSTVTGLSVVGQYSFRLAVTDDGGAVGQDTMIITVQAANAPPSVNAGADQTIQLPASTVTLNGVVTDPDGDAFVVSWEQTGGPVTAGITSPFTVSTGITGLSVAGNYTFTLEATDVNSNAASDSVTITVLEAAGGGNDPPEAEVTMIACTLQVTATDPDGTIASYAWTQVYGNFATIVSPSSATTQITGLQPGLYVFRCTVTDNEAATTLVDATINVGVDGTFTVYK